MPNIRMLSGLAAFGLAAASPAMAQNYHAPWETDFWGYLGASAGESKFRSDCAKVDVFACDKRDTAWRVYAGGKMNNIFGLEAGYTDFGKVQASGGDTKAWAAGLTLLAGVPIDRFNIFGKLGGYYGKTDVSASAESLVQTGHKTGWAWSAGVGGSFDITRNLQVRLDWDRYRLDFVGGARDVDMASAGLAIRF